MGREGRSFGCILWVVLDVQEWKALELSIEGFSKTYIFKVTLSFTERHMCHCRFFFNQLSALLDREGQISKCL